MKLRIGKIKAAGLAASPLGNGGRGLKHAFAAGITGHAGHRPSATGGVD